MGKHHSITFENLDKLLWEGFQHSQI